MAPEMMGKYFTWRELTASQAARTLAISNHPTTAAQHALAALCAEVLDPLREHLGIPVRVTSGFRSAELNEALGGAVQSQHVRGEAVDIKARGYDAPALARVIVTMDLPFDQLIGYHPSRGGHIHVSYTTRRPNRGEVRWAPPGGGYPMWDVDLAGDEHS